MNLEFFIRMKEFVSGGLAKMAATAQRTTAQMKSGNNILSQSYDELTSKIKYLESTISTSKSISHIREARKELSMLQKMQTSHIGNTETGGGSSWMGGMMRQALPAIGIAAALSLGSGTFNDAMAQTSQKSAINFATNGQGESAVGSVKSINNKYGLNDQAGVEGFKTLAGSVRSLNIPLSETLRIYESVGAAGAAMKVDAEAQKGIYLALGQIASKGTVSAEELRGQIGERLPGAFGIAAKAMGVTEQELGKMMQKGELLSKDFLPKFATELEKTFGKQALDEANSPSAIVNRFDNTMHAASITIGTMLMPAITTLMQGFINLVGWVKENWDWIGLLLTVVTAGAVGFGIYFVALNAVTWATAAHTAVVGYATTAWTWLSAAMTANPIGVIVVAFAALAAGVVYAWNKFEGFRMAIWGLWGAVKQVFSNIGDFFKKIFSPIFDAIQAFKEGRYLDAGKAVGQLALNLSPVGLIANAGILTKDVGKAFNTEKIKGIVPSSKNASELASPGGAADLISKPNTTATDTVAKGVTSGGPRVININGVKFTEKVEIHCQTFTEGMDQLTEKFDEYFLRILNSGAALQ